MWTEPKKPRTHASTGKYYCADADVEPLFLGVCDGWMAQLGFYRHARRTDDLYPTPEQAEESETARMATQAHSAMTPIAGVVTIAIDETMYEKMRAAGQSIDPTDKGIEEYEPNGFRDGKPCICRPTCEMGCKGECGCEACFDSYQDYLSME